MYHKPFKILQKRYRDQIETRNWKPETRNQTLVEGGVVELSCLAFLVTVSEDSSDLFFFPSFKTPLPRPLPLVCNVIQ